MGGECYHHLRGLENPSEKAVAAYRILFPSLVDIVREWWEQNARDNWTVRFGEEEDIYIMPPSSRYDFGPIVVPKELNDSLKIGWQHRRYGSVCDPLYGIAEKLMDGIKTHKVYPKIRGSLCETEEDNIRDDLGYESDNDYGRGGQFTPTSGWYSTGEGDRVWCMEGEEPDYTACGSECGYCGRCQY